MRTRMYLLKTSIMCLVKDKILLQLRDCIRRKLVFSIFRKYNFMLQKINACRNYTYLTSFLVILKTVNIIHLYYKEIKNKN